MSLTVDNNFYDDESRYFHSIFMECLYEKCETASILEFTNQIYPSIKEEIHCLSRCIQYAVVGNNDVLVKYIALNSEYAFYIEILDVCISRRETIDDLTKWVMSRVPEWYADGFLINSINRQRYDMVYLIIAKRQQLLKENLISPIDEKYINWVVYKLSVFDRSELIPIVLKV